MPRSLTMKALELADYANRPDSLRLVEKPLRQPGAGEVLVRIAAAPINPSDLMFARGMYGIVKPLPVVPGFEGSGTVVAAGPGLVGRALLGRRVAVVAPEDGDGTWAEYMLSAANRCIPLPKGVSLEQGASLVVNPISAWAMVEIARKEGHRALVQTAAASQLGRMVIRLARRFDLPVINVVRRAEQVELLRTFGARYILNSSLPAFAADLRAACQALGATLALDAVAGELSGQVLQALEPGGRLLVYGGLSEAACQIDPRALIFERKRVDGFWLSDWMPALPPLKLAHLALTLPRLLRDELATTIQARLPLAGATRGLAQYQESMSRGKVLLLPGL